jgi:hypothetical protein
VELWSEKPINRLFRVRVLANNQLANKEAKQPNMYSIQYKTLLWKDEMNSKNVHLSQNTCRDLLPLDDV